MRLRVLVRFWPYLVWNAFVHDLRFKCLSFFILQSVQNLKSLLYMSSTVENYKFPLGTRDNPAMTCKELMDIDDIQDGEKLHIFCEDCLIQ